MRPIQSSNTCCYTQAPQKRIKVPSMTKTVEFKRKPKPQHVPAKPKKKPNKKINKRHIPPRNNFPLNQRRFPSSNENFAKQMKLDDLVAGSQHMDPRIRRTSTKCLLDFCEGEHIPIEYYDRIAAVSVSRNGVFCQILCLSAVS
jgi:hypothetical protein